MYPCIESTIDIEASEKVVRLWINETEIKEETALHETIAKDIKDFIEMDSPTRNELVEFCRANVPNLNAIQIKDNSKDHSDYGLVVYLVEFSTDVHG